MPSKYLYNTYVLIYGTGTRFVRVYRERLRRRTKKGKEPAIQAEANRTVAALQLALALMIPANVGPTRKPHE